MNKIFSFADLFSGIGGFRIALEKLGGKCVFSCEIDKYAKITYHANFGEVPEHDITNHETKQKIPFNIDVICAGFPCQTFSHAGQKKGLNDDRGNLFFHLAEIINNKKPKTFLFENVKGLITHNKGETFRLMFDTLISAGYNVYYKVISGKNVVPQKRERVFIVGFNNEVFDKKENFTFPEIPENKTTLKNIIEQNVSDKYTLSDNTWTYLQYRKEKFKEKGYGFGYNLVTINDIANTLTARYARDGAEILLFQENKNPRRLTPRECARLQGFPDTFIIPVSDRQAYKQFGNSVIVPLAEKIGSKIIEKL